MIQRDKTVRGAGGGGGGKGGEQQSQAARVPVEQPDSLRSVQYARVLDLLSEGEIEGLVNGNKSIYFNDTPLERADGKFNFSGATITTRPGTQSQTYIEGFNSVEAEVAVSTQMVYGSDIIRSITNTNLDQLRLTFSFPRLTSQDTTTGDLSGTDVALGVSINNNGGGYIATDLTILPFPFKYSFNQTTYPNKKWQIETDGTNKISRATVNIKWTGTVPVTVPEQTAVQTKVVTLKYTHFSAPTVHTDFDTYTFTGTPTSSTKIVNGVAVTTWKAPTATYTTSVNLTKDHYYIWASYSGLEEAIQFVLSKCTGYSYQGYDIISGKTTSTYQKSYTILLPSPGPWDIKVYRITPDSTSSSLQNETWWSSYTEIINTKLSYPNSALVAISLNAEQFNAIPKRGYDIKGLKVKIPANYNPLTRVYSGTWDGSFITAWTDNPAWCFYDMITESRYGLGEFISESQVDKWALYEIAQYCDELVPDGNGGTEPRFTCNLYLQTQEEAYKVLNAMASIFRGMAYWAGGTIVAIQDSPQDATALFTPANIIDGQFQYQGASAKARHTVALVSWGDPASMYKPTVEYVEDVVGIERFGVRTTDIIAVGCTSRGQAHRVGKWLLYTERLEGEVISFKTGLEGLVVQPGNIIKTTDPIRSGRRMGGRIVSATTTVIDLDAPVILTKSAPHTLMVQIADPASKNELTVITSTFTAPTNTAAGTTISAQSITLTSALSTAPTINGMWVISDNNNLVPETWRVISITEIDGVNAEITALTHNPGKYASIEADITLEEPPTFGIPIGESLAVTEMNVEEYLFPITPSSAGLAAVVSWSGSSPTYILEWRRDNNNWETKEIITTSYDLKPINAGTYEFKITSISSLGIRSETFSNPAVYIGNLMLAAPVDIQRVNATYEGKTIWLEWDPVTDMRGITYEVRWGDTWGSAISFPMGTTTRFKTRGDGDFWVCALTGNGVYSANPKGIRIEGSTLVENVIATIDESGTNWSGDQVRVFPDPTYNAINLAGDELFSSIPSLFTSLPSIVLYDGHGADGYYYIPDGHVVDIGTAGSCQVTSSIIQDVHDATTKIGPQPVFSTIISLKNPLGGSGTVNIEMNIAQTDGVFSGWQPFKPGNYLARLFDFRLVLTSDNKLVSPYVYAWNITVDVPDRIISAEVTTPTGPLTVTFPTPFHDVAPKIQATIQNAIAGDDIVVTSITTSGMVLTVKNAGSNVARTVHYLAQGY